LRFQQTTHSRFAISSNSLTWTTTTTNKTQKTQFVQKPQFAISIVFSRWCGFRKRKKK
jgi:hypothetical protein